MANIWSRSPHVARARTKQQFGAMFGAYSGQCTATRCTPTPAKPAGSRTKSHYMTVICTGGPELGAGPSSRLCSRRLPKGSSATVVTTTAPQSNINGGRERVGCIQARSRFLYTWCLLSAHTDRLAPLLAAVRPVCGCRYGQVHTLVVAMSDARRTTPWPVCWQRPV